MDILDYFVTFLIAAGIIIYAVYALRFKKKKKTNDE